MNVGDRFADASLHPRGLHRAEGRAAADREHVVVERFRAAGFARLVDGR